MSAIIVYSAAGAVVKTYRAPAPRKAAFTPFAPFGRVVRRGLKGARRRRVSGHCVGRGRYSRRGVPSEMPMGRGGPRKCSDVLSESERR